MDKCFQSMHNGQTNGVPQGSVLSDFIAELVLGCCDEIVSNEIEEQIINDFLYWDIEMILDYLQIAKKMKKK